jgi:methoxymalonate biosynthesis acyl carrier protein
MTIDNATDSAVTAAAVEEDLLGFVESKTKTSVTADHDLFASGLVSSMFAMELVVYLEKTYGITIVGADLRLENFRTVTTMTELVLRLQQPSIAADGA